MIVPVLIAIVLADLGSAYAQRENNDCGIVECEGLFDNEFVQDVSNCRGWFRCSQHGPVFGENVFFN